MTDYQTLSEREGLKSRGFDGDHDAPETRAMTLLDELERQIMALIESRGVLEKRLSQGLRQVPEEARGMADRRSFGVNDNSAPINQRLQSAILQIEEQSRQLMQLADRAEI